MLERGMPCGMCRDPFIKPERLLEYLIAQTHWLHRSSLAVLSHYLRCHIEWLMSRLQQHSLGVEAPAGCQLEEQGRLGREQISNFLSVELRQVSQSLCVALSGLRQCTELRFQVAAAAQGLRFTARGSYVRLKNISSMSAGSAHLGDVMEAAVLEGEDLRFLRWIAERLDPSASPLQLVTRG
jgi:hypothetical protein